MSNISLHTIISLIIIISTKSVDGQFWKLNNLSERDLFILETRATMPSGICYKEVTGNSNDPELRIHIHSYCCDGYRRSSNEIRIQCDPICTEDCTNGICTAPDVCECYPGYLRMGGRCEEVYIAS